jgi:hypothetical protein
LICFFLSPSRSPRSSLCSPPCIPSFFYCYPFFFVLVVPGEISLFFCSPPPSGFLTPFWCARRIILFMTRSLKIQREQGGLIQA